MRSAIFFVVLGCASADAPVVQQPDNAPATSTVKLAPELQSMLDAHNRLRAQHCAEPLVWSDAIARAAQTWVDHLATRQCALQHSETSYGENISGGSASTQSPEQVARMWYGENTAYDFAGGGFSMRTGHFTQVVWRGSRQLGCASASCGDIRLWVCNYDPPGNMQGDFPRNVRPTTCR